MPEKLHFQGHRVFYLKGMEVDYEKSRWNFNKEIGSILIKNRKSSAKLIRAKIDDCFNNWNDIMPEHYSHSNYENKKELIDCKNIIEILKDKAIRYANGTIKLDSISNIYKIEDGTIIVSLNNGKEIRFVKELTYLLKLF